LVGDAAMRRCVVRRRREELGITQAELAERAGLQQPAVARFEAGGTMPTIPMLERLADALLLRLSVELRRTLLHKMQNTLHDTQRRAATPTPTATLPD
jgi:transcriptional regulator with XRE-family HTH domain